MRGRLGGETDDLFWLYSLPRIRIVFPSLSILLSHEREDPRKKEKGTLRPGEGIMNPVLVALDGKERNGAFLLRSTSVVMQARKYC